MQWARHGSLSAVRYRGVLRPGRASAPRTRGRAVVRARRGTGRLVPRRRRPGRRRGRAARRALRLWRGSASVLAPVAQPGWMMGDDRQHDARCPRTIGDNQQIAVPGLGDIPPVSLARPSRGTDLQVAGRMAARVFHSEGPLPARRAAEAPINPPGAWHPDPQEPRACRARTAVAVQGYPSGQDEAA